MPDKRVLIVSSNGLFREGLKHILSNTADLAPTIQTTSLQEAEELARSNQVDIVILDHADEPEQTKSQVNAISRLLSLPNLRVITVGLNTGELCVYRQERVEEASVNDLVAALKN